MKTSSMDHITLNIVMEWFMQRMDRKRSVPGFIIDVVPNIKVTTINPLSGRGVNWCHSGAQPELGCPNVRYLK